MKNWSGEDWFLFIVACTLASVLVTFGWWLFNSADNLIKLQGLTQ